LEPWDLDDDFFSLWQDARLMPHLHLPLQSGSRSVLKRMTRKTEPEGYRRLIASARAVIPDVAITTDVMVGFPGETGEEFSETLAFVREVDFAGGHVFTYSARPGTAAARMRGQVQHEVRRERSAILRKAFEGMAQVYRQRFIGKILSVLWESTSQVGENGWQLEGLTGNYLRVTATSPEPRWNQIDNVRLTGMTQAGLEGELVFPA
jgi:threonylcarbamoyladenosine tRNA methylthiotransferase MtaB